MWIGCMLVSSCKCCVFVSCVHPVAFINAAFVWFVVCLCWLRMPMETIWWWYAKVKVLLTDPRCSALNICSDLCVFCVSLFYVSLGSKVMPNICVCVCWEGGVIYM